MTPHLEAKPGEIADRILLPGDPLRAKYIAENFLEDAECYNQVRGMLGFTGTYQGKRISVQGTGMGVPSLSIYVHELLEVYGVKRLMRVGTCGALQEDLQIRDVILAMSASTDSAINKIRFGGMDFAPTASAEMLFKAHAEAQTMGLKVHAGPILTSDTFYGDDPDSWRIWAKFGVLAVEMESAALFSLAAKFGAQALTVLTVSDNLPRKEAASSADRQTGFTQMMELALRTI
jgi:purine-nucleoside phosphorylase